MHAYGQKSINRHKLARKLGLETLGPGPEAWEQALFRINAEINQIRPRNILCYIINYVKLINPQGWPGPVS